MYTNWIVLIISAILIVSGLFLLPYAIPSLKGMGHLELRDLVSIIAAIVAAFSFFAAYSSSRSADEANKRAERLFQAEIRPLIQVVPDVIIQLYSKNNEPFSVETRFSIVNYSGFLAKNIFIDLKYGSNSWIVEWISAKEKDNEPKPLPNNPMKYNLYPTLNPQIEKLGPGERTESAIRGSLNLEEHVCNREDPQTKQLLPLDVLVRSIWENEKGYRFTNLDRYELYCTKVDEGRSYFLMPK